MISLVPNCVMRAEGTVPLFAGLRDACGDPTIGPLLKGCTTLTIEANEQMTADHDRMPCILEPEQVGNWLNPDMTAADAIQSLRTSHGR